MGIPIHRLSNKNLVEKTAYCSKCERVVDFHVRRKRCLVAIREERKRRKRFLKEVRYNVKERGTRCEICGTEERKIVLDHDHKTLLFRGWLCNKCNLGLGLLGDTPENIYEALKYLTK